MFNVTVRVKGIHTTLQPQLQAQHGTTTTNYTTTIQLHYTRYPPHLGHPQTNHLGHPAKFAHSPHFGASLRPPPNALGAPMLILLTASTV